MPTMLTHAHTVHSGGFLQACRPGLRPATDSHVTAESMTEPENGDTLLLIVRIVF